MEWWERKRDRDRNEYMKVYMRERRERARASAPVKTKRNKSLDRPSMSLPFCGIDGEGGTQDGKHNYFLLRAGDRTLRVSRGERKLSSWECLEWLTGLPNDRIYVGFFFDYDVTKILEDVGFERLRRLMDRSCRKSAVGGSFPVDVGKFQIDYLPGKEFKVRKVTGLTYSPEGERKTVYSPWVVVNDVGPFFQCRFTVALERWGIGSGEERRLIDAGKELRAGFEQTNAEIDKYNALEIKLLQELMEKFRDACIAAGYLPNKWQGPGQLAEAMFRKHGFPKSRDVPLLNDPRFEELLKYGQNAFYGGRPELSVIGPVNRRTYQWDINSAYPHAMRYLPCLIHGTWSKVPKGKFPEARVVERNRYALLYGTFEVAPGDSSYLYGLPVRDKNGGIHYPAAGRGWYWNFEIDAAVHQMWETIDGWVYEKRCDCRPMEFVEEGYRERKRLGKNAAGMILKLMLNSLYGKCCQSVGSPRYANPIYASFITSYCRMMIQDFIHNSVSCDKGQCGIDVLAIATDSVMTWRDREDMEVSEELGGWDLETHEDGVFLVQPGVYFGSSGKDPKTRGLSMKAVKEREGEFREAFDAMMKPNNPVDGVERGVVRIPQHMFVGIRNALHRNRPELLGQWIDFGGIDANGEVVGGKAVSFDWRTKRADFVLRPGMGRTYLQTFPKVGSVDVETVPYSHDIGGLLKLKAEVEDWEAQPEWLPPVV